MVSAKTIMAMTPKPLEKCTYEQRLSIEQFREYQVLKSRFDEGLNPEEKARYEMLNEKNKHGKLRS